MGSSNIHRLLHLKKIFTKPTILFQFSKPPTNFQLITNFLYQTRNYRANFEVDDKPLDSQVIKFVAKSPESSVVPFIEKCRKEGCDFTVDDVRTVIRKLRRHKRLDHALEVSEWMISNLQSHPNSGDVAAQLVLIGDLHGVDAAERFFREVDVQTEKTYGALLNCYVKANLVDKSISHFKKIKDMGLAMSPLPYNNIMNLYNNIGQVEKVPELLSEMEDHNISPDNFSYRTCLKSFALKSDFTSMEKVMKKMESQDGLIIEWLTYLAVANYYIEGGFKEKAVHCLQKAELKVRDNPVAYNTLITTYTKIGDFNRVMSLWKRRKGAPKAPINADYLAIIGSLVKLDKLEEAERLLQEWESSGNFYDFRVPNVLLLGYIQKGLVDKAERMITGIISKGKSPIPNTWSIMSSGHIKCQNMEKALHCMKKALILGAQQKGWFPNPEAISSILKWLGDSGEITIVDEFLYTLSRVVPMDKEMYQTLLRANIRHGNDIDDILQSMKDSNIDVDEETSKIINSRTKS